MIGFVNLCHADYVDETMLAIVARAQKALADAGVELYAVERPVTDPWEGEAIGRDLLGRGVEGVILFMDRVPHRHGGGTGGGASAPMPMGLRHVPPR